MLGSSLSREGLTMTTPCKYYFVLPIFGAVSMTPFRLVDVARTLHTLKCVKFAVVSTVYSGVTTTSSFVAHETH